MFSAYKPSALCGAKLIVSVRASVLHEYPDISESKFAPPGPAKLFTSASGSKLDVFIALLNVKLSADGPLAPVMIAGPVEVTPGSRTLAGRSNAGVTVVLFAVAPELKLNPIPRRANAVQISRALAPPLSTCSARRTGSRADLTL